MKSQQSISIIQQLQKKKKQQKDKHDSEFLKERFRKYKNTLQTKQDLAKQGENYYNFLQEEKKLQRQSISQHGISIVDQNASSQLQKGMNRKKRYVQTLDPNQLPASTSAKNEKQMELESQKIQKLKQKMNLINEIYVQQPDVITSLSIKPISNKLDLYTPFKRHIKHKSNSQYMKSDNHDFLNSPIDSYLLKKLEKIVEGKQEKTMEQFSPEAPSRQSRKLLPLQSLNRHKNSFFGDQTAQRIDYKSEICRDESLQFDNLKLQSKQQLTKVFNQLQMSGSNRNYNLNSLE